MNRILVTGTAGFIGFHVALRLAREGYEVIGLDNINDYYDVDLKLGRLAESGFNTDEIEYGTFLVSSKFPNYRFIKLDLADTDGVLKLFGDVKFDTVCNLAAQAGVRYSLEDPYAYIDSNIHGFLNVLEAAVQFRVEHLVFASSSSVYGLNRKQPFSEHHPVEHPVSLYAATKKSNELMAHAYSHLFGVSITGLRFFTVYGPWGRPDMALFRFVKNILNDEPIEVYNYGDMERDFTYIDDVVEGVVRVLSKPAKPNAAFDPLSPDPAISSAAYRIYNIGNSQPVRLTEFIEAIEEVLGKKAKIELMPLQKGDVVSTYADVSDLINDFGYKPQTPVKEGIKKFVEWFKKFYGIT